MNRNFVATYRLQLHKDFGFKEVREIADYLFELGISHLYLSPILESVKGSAHGYDVTDPLKFSSERGGEKEWRKLLKFLKEEHPDRGMIVDIVPNHIGASWENPYWRDLLANGPSSPYFELFDIYARERAPEEDEPIWYFGSELRLVLPALGDSITQVLKRQELILDIDETGVFFRYWDNRFPVAASSYHDLLESFFGASSDEVQQKSCQDLKEISALFASLPRWSQSISPEERWRRWKSFNHYKSKLWSLLSEDTELQSQLKKHIQSLSKKDLQKILSDQPYELAFWKEGATRINYRRFFDISDLAAMRMEDGQVFDFTHTKVAEIAKEFSVDGLRVDHVDGLWNPRQYLISLKRICPNIWIEKILGAGEEIPSDWPVLGCTGYEFMNVALALMVDQKGCQKMESHYRRSVHLPWRDFHSCVELSKRYVFRTFFQAEWKRLTEQFYELSEENGYSLTREEIAQGICEITVGLPVYRTYIEAVFAASDQDRRYLAQAFEHWKLKGEVTQACFRFFEDTFTGKLNSYSPNLQQWVYRWQQLSGPVMAKGLEDTTFYRDYPLLAFNEVGGEGAAQLHSDPEENWQNFIQDRLMKQPLALNASSTHDTKRSEGVRCRIASLSDYSDEWIEFFNHHSKSNSKYKTSIDGETCPSLNEEWLIYQTLLATWPYDSVIDETFKERMQSYFEKAFREAKLNTSWRQVNQEWEEGVRSFVEKLLNQDLSQDFMSDLERFSKKLYISGALKELSLLALKCLAPGVPDFYQGSELWDDSLVDPDNRRPVDYELRIEKLKSLKKRAKSGDEVLIRDLAASWQDGALKMWVTHQLLEWRRLHPEGIERFRSYSLSGSDSHCFRAYLRESSSHNLLMILPIRAIGESHCLDSRSMDISFDFDAITGLGVVVEDVLRGTESSSINVLETLREFPLGIFYWSK